MDAAGHVLLTAHELYTRADNSTSNPSETTNHPTSYKIIGLVLALSSGLFIGVSFVLKKVGLLKANAKYNEEAGEGYGYLKNAYWWTGMTLMILGEICNFAAYLFTDAILVTPLGALSVVITAILSAIFLKERLSFVGKIGCFNCIIGAVVIAVNAPEQSAVSTIQEMKKMVLAPGFIVYGLVIIIGCAIVAFWLGPKYGKKTMMVYLTVCSLIGGLSVVGIQGIGAAITAQARGIPQFNQWFLYVLLAFIIITLVTEIIYLNKALNLYNAALVTPTYYVFFTSAVIVSSAVLFQGFKGTPIQIVTVILGFLQVCAGVVLLQLSKSAKDVPDTVVFAGDVDQVRTVAEQEEPEYEPRADTIRGSAALLRSISTARQKRSMQEVDQLREEHMHPIREDEPVEFDGLRRRRTLLRPDSSTGGSISRRKTVHPPLGMSRFPQPEEDDNDDFHPGFFNFRRKHHTQAAGGPGDGAAAVPLSPMKTGSTGQLERVGSRDSGEEVPHVYGLPQGLQRARGIQDTDTSYKGPSTSSGSQHIHFAGDTRDPRSTLGSTAAAGTLSPPPPAPPPHRESSTRHFSFQNVFHRNRGSSPGESSDRRPVSRGALSFVSRKSSSNNTHNRTDGTTEEERLGLVKGDSHDILNREDYSGSPPEYNHHYLDDADDDWNADLGHGRSQRMPEGQPRNLTERDQQQPPGYRRASDDSESGDSKEVEGGRKPGGGGSPGRGPGGAGYI